MSISADKRGGIVFMNPEFSSHCQQCTNCTMILLVKRNISMKKQVLPLDKQINHFGNEITIANKYPILEVPIQTAEADPCIFAVRVSMSTIFQKAKSYG